jgi:uncharacterized protein (TIGR00251 family)
MPVSADGEGGARLRVRVTPRAKQNALAGLTDVAGKAALAIRLAVPPVDGAANQALVRFLADGLNVSKSAIRLVAGETSRLKTLSLAGVAPERITAWIKQMS